MLAPLALLEQPAQEEKEKEKEEGSHASWLGARGGRVFMRMRDRC